MPTFHSLGERYPRRGYRRGTAYHPFVRVNRYLLQLLGREVRLQALGRK